VADRRADPEPELVALAVPGPGHRIEAVAHRHGEADELGRRHAERFCQVAEGMDRLLRGREQLTALRNLDDVADQLRGKSWSPRQMPQTIASDFCGIGATNRDDCGADEQCESAEEYARQRLPREIVEQAVRRIAGEPNSKSCREPRSWSAVARAGLWRHASIVRRCRAPQSGTPRRRQLRRLRRDRSGKDCGSGSAKEL
jgi:hypothetical protein